MKTVAALSLFLIVIGMVEIIGSTEGAVTCGAVDSAITPCAGYLTQGGSPSAACCTGVTNIKNMATTQVDRRAACECLKAAATKLANIKPDAASNLPGKCGVDVGVPISKTVNCQSIP